MSRTKQGSSVSIATRRSLALLLLVAATTSLRADVRLPRIFGDHLVLQRDTPVPVWGWATPGEEVTVELGGTRLSTAAGVEGRWRVDLPAMPAGGPFQLVVSAGNTITLDDLLVGEVWLCSGQSNMEMGVGVVADGEVEVAGADHPEIRLFELPQTCAGEPRDDVSASWRVCRPDTLGEGNWGGFTAVGYFFGRKLHAELGVPIGLVDSAWGGTLIEPWTPPCGFASVPSLERFVVDIEEKNRRYREELPGRLDEIERWIEAMRGSLADGKRLPVSPWWPRHPLESYDQPTGIYNGMIHPLIPFAIRGVIWYQGESNVHTSDRMTYLDKMKALIGGWRELWGRGDFPFYYVQIAPFNYDWHKPGIDPEEVPRLWEAQTASLSIPNTGMVVTTDLADLRDIHPARKREVGERLARWALARTYGVEGLVCCGPLYRSATVEGDRMRIELEHTEGGLKTLDGEPPSWFQIAGADRQFIDARAEIDGETVVVWSGDVPEPVAVRFGFHMLAEPNLANGAGLPASPFRTDEW
jgi:sialate O-acetylesterase